MAALVLMCALGTASAQPDEASARAAEERAANAKLVELRGRIKALAEEQRATSGEHAEATRALREHELAIAAATAGVRALDGTFSTQKDELDRLEARRGELAGALEGQREALAVLMRSAYALGRSEELKLLLQQEDVGTIARVLAYHRYFQRARIERIDGLLEDLAELAEVQQAILAQAGVLEATRLERERELARLEAQRAERAELLTDLDRVLKDQQARLLALGKDERGLSSLLERLRDVFADIPKQISGAEPFARLRGRMPWPLQGTLATGFGARDDGGRKLSGLLIAAKAGAPVQAIARGRVAFADWLKGYGMLLILDHGDGYMSLYGYNESLVREVGDWVGAGETIAHSGASGGQSSPALYFELRHQGKPIDPQPWLR